MTFPADRRIPTRHGLLDVLVEVRPTGVVARLARPEDHPGLSVLSAAVGQDEEDAVERLQAAVDAVGLDVIQGHVVRPGDPEPPADGLPVFRFGRVRSSPQGDVED